MASPRDGRRVLVTGAAGYIGSHAALTLLESGDRVLGLDNLSRGHLGAVQILKKIGGPNFDFVKADLLDHAQLLSVMRDFRPEVVIHFAALAYVGESVHEPCRYWTNNTMGSLSLLDAMRRCGAHRIVFSSTCATYGTPAPAHLPITERCPQTPINPYGRSKLAVEQALLDSCGSREWPELGVALLRYFNVAGSDPQGRLGEDHRPETHLVPICLEVALGQRERVEVFGADYPTPDGTCVRDYVHVTDLVDAHRSALERVAPGTALIANIGIGRGFSVREVIDSCRRVTGAAIPHRDAPRREGDPAELFSDPGEAHRLLKWSPRFTSLDETVATAWHWRRAHPHGYAE
ncbi:MAG: UDP-glucose 4-epimerase GalE [Phycisphaeraceae bacterium]|nr:UDP-glucose 4-epimerase GalE [Phycisphaeraceae bacterium]